MVPPTQATRGGSVINSIYLSLESEARALLTETTEEYAAALEAAGPELDRLVDIAGGMLRAPRAALFPVMDLFHHHGQVCYIQTLLGDKEQHWDGDAINELWGPDSPEP